MKRAERKARHRVLRESILEQPSQGFGQYADWINRWVPNGIDVPMTLTRGQITYVCVSARVDVNLGVRALYRPERILNASGK